MKNSQNAFTILEFLLVAFLLVLLAMTTFNSVRDTIRTKEMIDYRTENLQSARAVLSLIDRDIRAAFFVKAEDLTWRVAKPTKPDVVYPEPIKPRTVTIFQGKTTEIFFSAGSHQRMSVDVPENEQHFVTYQLNGSELIRGETSRATRVEDREDTPQFRQFTLLTKVKSLKFEYFDLKRDKWVEAWDTESADYFERMPIAVKVTLEYTPEVENVDDKTKETVSISTVIKILEAGLKNEAL